MTDEDDLAQHSRCLFLCYRDVWNLLFDMDKSLPSIETQRKDLESPEQHVDGPEGISRYQREDNIDPGQGNVEAQRPPKSRC